MRALLAGASSASAGAATKALAAKRARAADVELFKDGVMAGSLRVG
jgi:hypothetical protein